MMSKKFNSEKIVSNKENFVLRADAMQKEDISLLPSSAVRKYEPKIFAYKKRRPISWKDHKWTIDDAKKAIFLEQMFMERQQKNTTLVISFPDQKLNSSIVRGYSSNIDSVSFIQSASPRYCHVTLKPGSNAKDEIAKISKIPFQNGFLKAKVKAPIQMEPAPIPREVDPSTLYVGNLPPDISVGEIKEHFPKAVRIDVGYSLKQKWRRYALVKYASPEEAMYSFAVSYESSIRSISLVVRFHRVKHWKILEEAEIQNEIARLKIKKEKVDEEYEAAIRRAQVGCHSVEGPLVFNDSKVTHFAPAQYPIARPLIDPSMIKKEPISPEHRTYEVEYSANTNEHFEKWNQFMQMSQFMMLNQSQNQKRLQVENNHQFDAQQQLFPEQLMQCMQQQGQIFNPIPDSWKNFMVSGAPGYQPPAMESTDLSQGNKKPGAYNKHISDYQQIMEGSNLNKRKNTVDFGQAKSDIMKLPRIPKKRANESTIASLETGGDNLISSKLFKEIDNQNPSCSILNFPETDQRSPQNRFQQSLKKPIEIGYPTIQIPDDLDITNTKMEPMKKSIKKRKRTKNMKKATNNK